MTMPKAASDPDPGRGLDLPEATKDRGSIKLMDLPLSSPDKDQTHPSRSSQPMPDPAHVSTSSDSNANPPTAMTTGAPRKRAGSNAAGSTTSLTSPTTVLSPSSKSNASASDWMDSGSDSDSDSSKTPDDSAQEDPSSSSSAVDRVGNPPHYESREERLRRIRKQFQLDHHHQTGYIDSNSLVGFFAEYTSDEEVQKRYAEELLQLCHARKLRRMDMKNGSPGSNNSSSDYPSHHLYHEQHLPPPPPPPAPHHHHQGKHSGPGPEPDQPQQDSKDGSSNQNQSGQLHYEDFHLFVEEKEERLWNLFREIDHNNDNEIQPDELQASLAKAGIQMSDAELEVFIRAMDKDGNGVIDFEEWRDFLVLLPRETTLKEIYKYVTEVIAQVGVDGDVVMPPSENDFVARYLFAGAIAGAVSRSVTAPLDRLKVYLITSSAPKLTGPAAASALKHIPKLTSPGHANTPANQRLLWRAIVELYNQGGIRTFFRGNGLNIIKIAPESAIKFYTYESSKWFIVNHLPSLTIQFPPEVGVNGASPQQPPPDIAAAGRFLAGGVAGLVSQFSIYPLETIKTRIMSSSVVKQTTTASVAPASSTLSSSSPASPSPASTASTASSSTSSSSSSKTLSSRTATTSGRLPISPPTTSTPSTSALSSLSTSTSASYSSSTTSSLQQSTSSTSTQKPSIRSVALEVWRQAGVRGFYRGLGASLVGIFPYAAIDLSVFETLKFGYMRWKAGVHEGDPGSEEKNLERPSVFVLLACGTISGSVGATTVYPLSLVRTRLQAQGTPQHPQTYSSTLDVFRKTFEQDGLRGFYKGMVPTLTKVVPAVSISYVVYEYSKRELGL